MNHIDVTSQLDRHKMLMDLAAKVKDHLDKNPAQHDSQGEPETQINPVHIYQSSK